MAVTIRLMFALCICLALSSTASGRPLEASSEGPERRELVAESTGSYQQVSVPCDESQVGSKASCWDFRIPAAGAEDYSPKDRHVRIPKNGFPWGVHITPPEDSSEPVYTISWNMGEPTVAPPPDELPDVSYYPGFVRLGVVRGMTDKGLPGVAELNAAAANKDCEADWPRTVDTTVTTHSIIDNVGPNNCYSFEYQSRVITYLRNFTVSGMEKYSYLSSHLHHVLVPGLASNTKYRYRVGNGTHWSKEYQFNTLRVPQGIEDHHVYPFKIGVMADVGQTKNSSKTRDRMIASNPDVVLNVGDLAYADNYAPYNDHNPGEMGNNVGSNQKRWDTFQVLWEPLFARFPTMHAAGDHEIEDFGINANLNISNTEFSYPDNYPFQSYSARFPRAGQRKFGDISSNLYYESKVGPVHVFVLCNYIPFHEGTPQYEWFNDRVQKVNRQVTPWLMVMFHAPIYHSYYNHYKDMECFREIYEGLFYVYQVDLVMSGHVHGYERTHPMIEYEVTTCGPAYITVGDGGNVEGPYRNFVDEQVPLDVAESLQQAMPHLNLTVHEGNTTRDLRYCDLMPNPKTTTKYGPGYQIDVQPIGCGTASFQEPNTFDSGPGLRPDPENPAYFFCQSAQPIWSAYRDPSFGHAVLNILSPTKLELMWYKNADPRGAQSQDYILLTRPSCLIFHDASPPPPPAPTAAPTKPEPTLTPQGAPTAPTPAPLGPPTDAPPGSEGVFGTNTVPSLPTDGLHGAVAGSPKKDAGKEPVGLTGFLVATIIVTICVSVLLALNHFKRLHDRKNKKKPGAAPGEVRSIGSQWLFNRGAQKTYEAAPGDEPTTELSYSKGTTYGTAPAKQPDEKKV